MVTILGGRRRAACRPAFKDAPMSKRVSSAHHPNLPESLALAVDAACQRFEAAWKKGARPRIEDRMAEAPPELRPVLLRELLALELVYRRNRGEVPRPE